MTVIPFKPKPSLYSAQKFTANTVFGSFETSGTLCGLIDFIGPFPGCYSLTPDEALAVIMALQRSREDVLENSDPMGDPRIIDR